MGGGGELATTISFNPSVGVPFCRPVLYGEVFCWTFNFLVVSGQAEAWFILQNLFFFFFFHFSLLSLWTSGYR